MVLGGGSLIRLQSRVGWGCRHLKARPGPGDLRVHVVGRWVPAGDRKPVSLTTWVFLEGCLRVFTTRRLASLEAERESTVEAVTSFMSEPQKSPIFIFVLLFWLAGSALFTVSRGSAKCEH